MAASFLASSLTFSLPLPPVLGLLHGNYLDDALVVGVVLYLAGMLILARFRSRQLKRKKELKAARKRKALLSEIEEGPASEDSGTLPDG